MYQSDRLEVAIVYGRRRVGKTTLITEFCKGKRAVFYAAMESTAQENLQAFSLAIAESAGGGEVGFTYHSFADAFHAILQMAQKERIILVIDEYPYLAQAERGISSLLQNLLDHEMKASKLFLILCGSSMSFMENQVLGYQSYRRYYYLFSKAGFTEALRAREKDGQVRLIQLEEMYGDARRP